MRVPVLLRWWAFQAALFSDRVHVLAFDSCPTHVPDEPRTPYSDDTDIGPCYYTNPIVNKGGVGDPWAFRHDGHYYLTYTDKPWTNVVLYKSKKLTNWDNAENKTIFLAPTESECAGAIWAPEIHKMYNSWWLIFTASPSGVATGGDHIKHDVEQKCQFDCEAFCHRMFVVQGSGPDSDTLPDPFDATWGNATKLDTYDQFAIDGTYFQYKKHLYHIYSCWDDKYSVWPANLCITKMKKDNPRKVESASDERVVISRPDEPWEMTPHNRSNLPRYKNSPGKHRLATNEGPQMLQNPKTKTWFLIYSAGRSDNRNYCLGMLEFLGRSGGPMNPKNWKKHTDGCVFRESEENGVFGVGHASFVKSPDGSEDWVVYHGMSDARTGWTGRMIRAQRFGWDERTGRPVFPVPQAEKQMKVPSGQADSCGKR